MIVNRFLTKTFVLSYTTISILPSLSDSEDALVIQCLCDTHLVFYAVVNQVVHGDPARFRCR